MMVHRCKCPRQDSNLQPLLRSETTATSHYVRRRYTARLNRLLSVSLSGFSCPNSSQVLAEPPTEANDFLISMADPPLIRHSCEKSAT